MTSILPHLRHYIYTIGRTRVAILTTILATVLALCFTLFFEYCLHLIGVNVNPVAAVIISISVTLITTPILSWIFISLIIHVHELEEEMRELASYDSLTGLLCRREFIDRAGQLYKISKRDGLEFSLVILDFDNFKVINDQYGHIAGDKVLESFGKAVRTTLRESDLASRFGGDEFVFFLPNTSTAEALRFTERLQKKINDDLSVSPIPYSASMGLATYPDVFAERLEDIISAADRALYHSKNMGKNQIQIFKSYRYVNQNLEKEILHMGGETEKIITLGF